MSGDIEAIAEKAADDLRAESPFEWSDIHQQYRVIPAFVRALTSLQEREAREVEQEVLVTLDATTTPDASVASLQEEVEQLRKDKAKLEEIIRNCS